MPFHRVNHIAAVSLWLSGCWQRPDHALHAKLPEQTIIKSMCKLARVQVSDSTALLLVTQVRPAQKQIILICLKCFTTTHWNAEGSGSR